MLFNNCNIDNIPVIKQLCKDILGGFFAKRDNFNITDECNLLTDYIKEVIKSKSKIVCKILIICKYTLNV